MPASDPAQYGPWFIAAYNGSCAGCGDDIADGDEIRADGRNGWLGRCCGGDDEPVRELPQVHIPAAVRTRMNPQRALRDVQLSPGAFMRSQ